VTLKPASAGNCLRAFGPRDLTSDGIYRSNATILLNADVGYQIGEKWRIAAEFLNLLDRKDHDIDYAYTSRITPPLRRHSQMFSTPLNRFRCDSH